MSGCYNPHVCTSPGGHAAIIIHDRPRRGRRRATPRRRAPRRQRTAAPNLMFLATMVFLVATIVLLGLSFRDLLSYKPASVSTAPVGPPPSGMPSGAGPREVVLRLRDMVGGTVYLQGTPLALSAAQCADLRGLMPAVRANLQGPPTAVDDKLEKQFLAVLTAPQVSAIKQWQESDKAPPDFIQNLATLERTVGVK